MSPHTVLVVDDDSLSRTALSDLLDRHGFETVEAASGVEALDRFGAGAFHAVVTDLRMPGMDGIELLSRLRAVDAGVPVILVTAYGTVQTAVEAMKVGASDYVTKPFSSQEILAALQRQVNLRELKVENRRLKGQVNARYRFDTIVGRSDGMRRVFDLIETVADSRSTVLVHGESGTGKELVARALHHNSPRGDGAFVPVSCAALSQSLLESELFGHERGAFTGAVSARAGRVEAAHGGTLFLDDVDDIPLAAQVKLLRVLQERVVERVGSSKARAVDVRVVAATKVDLRELVSEGRFREDLYYRLSVIPVRIPPLRERRDDVAPLVEHFFRQFAQRDGRPPMRISADALSALEDYDWPGNVRQLEHVVERLVATCAGDSCGVDTLPREILAGGGDRLASELPQLGDEGLDLLEELDRFEIRIIGWALERSRGNKSATARLLRLSRSTLADHMRRLGIRRDGRLE